VKVVAVSRALGHRFFKTNEMWINLIAGFGVEGDAHAGKTAKRRMRFARTSEKPNLRQVHLLPNELLAELRGKGFDIRAGQIGENVLTDGIDLISLAAGTRVHLGSEAVVELTGLRTPCYQMERFSKGLMAAVIDRDANGARVLRAGVMSTVLAGGEVHPGDPIWLEAPDGPRRPLRPL
jgi:MOSC domain-containing protein YiiM